MCIIVGKNRNAKLPDDKILKNCFDNNSDGAGFMYVDNGEVVIDKGYMTYKSFIDRYHELSKKYNKFKNKCLVMHFRIGTSSANSPENTHPYPLTKKMKDLHLLDTRCEVGVVHNGIITDYTPKDKKAPINDTGYFIINYLSELPKEFYKNKYLMNGIEKISNSKFVFLTKEDKMYSVGEFVNDKNIIYSNDTFKYSWYNKVVPKYLPKGTTIMLSDGTEIIVNKEKFTITYMGELYENGSLVDIDAIAFDEYGEVIYCDGEDYCSKLYGYYDTY